MNHDISNKRVLHIIYSLNAGGIETFIVNILKNIDIEQVKFDFLVIREKGTEQFYDSEVLKYGSRIIEVGGTNKNKVTKYLKSRRDIYTYLKKTDYKIVHIHSGQIDKLPDAIVAKLLHIPTIIMHSHNQGLTKSARFYYVRLCLHKLLKPTNTMLPTHCFACSKAAADWTFSKKANRENKVVIINNGIDSRRFAYREDIRNEYRQKLQLQEKFVIGHIGRFNYQKNHDFLIDIFSEIVKRNRSSALLLIGTGELEPEIKEKVKKLGIEQQVIFYGVTDKIPEMIQAMDVFLLPSHFEGLPVVGIEVQAAALQTVAADTITEEVAITDKWKFMSLGDSAGKWAEEILTYQVGYKREDMTRRIKSAGYDVKTIANYLENLYTKRLDQLEENGDYRSCLNGNTSKE